MPYKYFLLFFVIHLLIFATQSNAQNDSANNTQKYNYKNYIASAALITYGMICWGNNGLPSSLDVKEYRDKHYGTFNNSIDDYLVFSPGIIMLGMDACKVKSKSDFINQMAIGVKSMALSLAVVNILKYTTSVTRPDGSADNSFASGHAAAAFTFAEALHQEYKHKPLLVISGYTLATTVSTMRILNNRHWFSDVLVGAGIGMVATKLIYATHQYKWKKKGNKLLPVLSSNQLGFLYTF